MFVTVLGEWNDPERCVANDERSAATHKCISNTTLHTRFSIYTRLSIYSLMRQHIIYIYISTQIHLKYNAECKIYKILYGARLSITLYIYMYNCLYMSA